MYARRVLPVLIMVLVAVPLVVIAFLTLRRKTAANELLVSDDPDERARTEQEFAEAEAYEAEWREQDKEKLHQERLP